MQNKPNQINILIQEILDTVTSKTHYINVGGLPMVATMFSKQNPTVTNKAIKMLQAKNGKYAIQNYLQPYIVQFVNTNKDLLLPYKLL